MAIVRGSSRKYLAYDVLRYLVIIIMSVLVAFPIYWMILTALQDPNVTLQYPPSFYPKSPNLLGFHQLFTDNPMGRWLLNSAFVASIATAVTTTFGILGAYALSNFRWRGKILFSFILLFTQMMPEVLVIIPIYEIFARFHLTNDLIALAFLHSAFVVPVCIWILKPAFRGIPKEVNEAAQIDGCSQMKILQKIVIPICSPAIIAVGVVAFFASWGDFLWGVTMISTRSMFPASVGLASTISQLNTPVQELLSGAFIYGLPPVILYIFVQRYVISGLTAGAIKG